MSNDLAAILHEFAARKTQILNLEMRLFIVLLFSQLLVVSYGIAAALIPKQQMGSVKIATAAAFATALLVALGTNAKMGLVSIYLKQLEAFLEAHNNIGLVWERHVATEWIFVPGNAFTVSAVVVVAVLLSEFYFISQGALENVLGTRLVSVAVSLLLTAAFAGLVVKAATVDFGKHPDSFFESPSARP